MVNQDCANREPVKGTSMQFQSIAHDTVEPRAPATVRHDLLLAVALALILTVCWAMTDWVRLSRLMLPDPDDTMRLLQVRDWIAGQGMNDWTQYRMQPPSGARMHWSRVNDVGIAAIILLARPFVGQPHAELIAVLLYPGLLFGLALFLSARIARRLWGAPATLPATILTALAFPGSTVFIPGRIDHHALQAVLIQALVLLTMRRPTLRMGLITGAIAAISLVVGLETAPQVAIVMIVLFCLWVGGRSGERARMAGFAAALAGVTGVFLLFLRPTFWTAGYCDAFTPASSTAALAAAAALGALVVLDPVLRDWRRRLIAGAFLGGGALAGTLAAFPACIDGPYGAVDPVLRALFFPHIVEAAGIFAQSGISAMLAVGGVVAAGCLTSVWMIARAPRRWPETGPIVAVLWVSALVMVAQVRGAYIGAPLAPPILAGLIVAARQRERWRAVGITGAWLAGTGLVYLEVPTRIEAWFRDTRLVKSDAQVACTAGDPWKEIDRYPAGTVMTGTNVAAYLIGSTHHSTIGAGYHRNNSANMAIYRFFLGKPDQARTIARRWNVRYVLYCPGDFVEVDPGRNFPGSLVIALRDGRAPAWLTPLPVRNTPLRLYRVARAIKPVRSHPPV